MGTARNGDIIVNEIVEKTVAGAVAGVLIKDEIGGLIGGATGFITGTVTGIVKSSRELIDCQNKETAEREKEVKRTSIEI